MSHRRALLFRWSTRDRLAVLVVAVTVAFLAGTGLLIVAGADQPTRIAAEYGPGGTVEGYDSVASARTAASDGDLLLPTATASMPDGSISVVVGIPTAGTAAFTDRTGIEIGDPPESGVSSATGPGRSGSADNHVRLEGESSIATVATSARPATPSVVPPDWLIANPALVDRLGTTGAIVLSPAEDPLTVRRGETPLRGALAFFVTGATGVTRVFSVAALGTGLLILVTVFSVTRMTVRDRRRTIAMIRATGAQPRHVLALFGFRGMLLVALGTSVGVALGVIATNAASNLAVTTGVPTSLHPRVTARLAVAFGGLLAGASVLGVIAGVVAAWPAVRRPPGRNWGDGSGPGGRGSNQSVIGWLGRTPTPVLLDTRALVPTAATLAAFALLVLLGVSVGATASSVVAPGTATITEPGASHPIASSVPEEYAAALREEGTPASAEILLFTVVRGHPVAARGADYGAFAAVSDASLVTGRRPAGPGEAVIGTDLARSIDVDAGDTLLVGGSTQPGFAPVSVVGTFAAPGVFDDQLVVSLAAARHLSTRREGTVHFVRLASGRPPAGSTPEVTVVAVDAPTTVVANDTLPVAITLQNPTSATRTETVVARLGPSENRTTATIDAGRTVTVRLGLATGSPGEYDLRVGDRTATVAVVPRDSLRIRGLPETVPVGSEPLVRVVDATGAPVPGARLTIGNRTVRSGPNGTARVPFDDAGTHRLVASVGERSTSTTVDVSPGARRVPNARLAIVPETPTVLARPTAHVTLENPWRSRLNETVAIEGPNTSATRTVTIPPGEDRTLSVTLPRRPPGRYDVAVLAGGGPIATTDYPVRGDPRLSAALASSRDGPSGSGIGLGIATVLGNLQTLLATVVALAGVMAAGAATATFSQAVHARRHTIGIHRATGATPRQVHLLVVRDAVLLGGVATVAGVATAFVAFRGLAAAGYLTVYGVRIAPPSSPVVLLGVAVCGLALVVVAAGIAARRLLRVEPIGLLAPERSIDDRAAGGERGG